MFSPPAKSTEVGKSRALSPNICRSPLGQAATFQPTHSCRRQEAVPGLCGLHKPDLPAQRGAHCSFIRVGLPFFPISLPTITCFPQPGSSTGSYWPKHPRLNKSLASCVSKELSQFHFDFFQTSPVPLKMGAASTSAAISPHRRLCVPVLLATNCTKTGSPANPQVGF